MRLILLLLLVPVALVAAPLPRTVLALYNSTHNPSLNDRDNPIAQYAQLPLNWLGLNVRYHDIAKGLPSAKEMDDLYAILSWFYESKMDDPAAYIEWAVQQIDQGKRFVIFGDPGCFTNLQDQMVPLSQVNRLLNKIGLRYVGGWSDKTATLSIAEKDPKMVDFEQVLNSSDIGSSYQITPFGEGNALYLTLNSTLWPGMPIAAVSRSPHGGYAAIQLATSMATGDSRWYLDPFAFFNQALQLEKSPRFDPTTLFGRRIAISHIDGDGIRNATEIKEFKGGPSAQAILEKVLSGSSMPTSASFISCEVDPRYMGSSQIIGIAKEIFALDNVECASHTFSHPLDWKRKITTFTISGYSRTIPASELEEIEFESGYSKGAIVEVSTEEYLEREVVEAAAYLEESIAPIDKGVNALFWSGNCVPQEEAIALCADHHLMNINGGDSRFDRSHPSYTYVAPYGRPVGEQFQIYAINASDELYTNHWTGPFYGQRYLIETFQQTERPTLIHAPPRRVAGMDLYYHFFSGEKLAAVKTLDQLIDYLLDQPTIPLWTSDYCAVVNGWRMGKIDQMEEGGWHFSNYGLCRTVRFDPPVESPDLAKSKGVVGFTRWEEFLYVTLAEGEATLYFSQASPTQPYLVEASSILEQLVIDQRKIEFSTRTHGSSIYRFANLLPSTNYGSFTSDAQGELTVTFDQPLQGKVEISAP